MLLLNINSLHFNTENEWKLSHRRELCRLRRERKTTEEREERLAKNVCNVDMLV